MTRYSAPRGNQKAADEQLRREEAVALAISLYRLHDALARAAGSAPARRVTITQLRWIGVQLRALSAPLAREFLNPDRLLAILVLATPLTCTPDEVSPDWAGLEEFRAAVAEIAVRLADRELEALLAHPAPEVRSAALVAMGTQQAERKAATKRRR